MSAPAETTLAQVAGELYGALLEARPIVRRRLEVVREHGSEAVYARTERTLDRIDAALGDAADYLGGDET